MDTEGRKNLYMGIDIGFWNDKGMLLSGGAPVETCFQSLTAKQYTGVISGDRVSGIPHNLQGFSYGDLAARYSGAIPEMQTSRSWIFSELHDNLIRATCHQLGVRDGDEINLCISLPYSWFKVDAKKFTEHLRSTAWGFTTVSGELISFSFDRIFVIPQDFGVVCDEVYGNDGNIKDDSLTKGEVLTIGIGGHTAGDLHLIDFQDTGYSDTHENCGMWKAVNALRDRLVNDHGCEVSKVEASRVMTGGEFSYKGKHDYSEYIETLKYDLFQTVINTIQSKIDIFKVERILLAGGTGKLLFPYFQELYDEQKVMLAEHPIMGQAAGNAKFAKAQCLSGKGKS